MNENGLENEKWPAGGFSIVEIMEVGEGFVERSPVIRVEPWPVGPVEVDVDVSGDIPVETRTLSREEHAAADLLGVTDKALPPKLQIDGVEL
jgi:hypothetical protein